MPSYRSKNGVHLYDRPIRIRDTTESFQKVVAIAYMEQEKEFSVIFRKMIHGGIEIYLSRLTPAKRAEFDQILANVKLTFKTKEDIKKDSGEK